MKKIPRFNVGLFLIAFSIIAINIRAQNCIQTSQYPSGTVSIAGTGSTQVTSCNYAGEFSINNFTTAGFYYINSTGGVSNYITVTDNANTPIASGYAPLGVTIPSAGFYRIHISLGPTCGTDAACHLVTVSSGARCVNTFQYPTSTVNIASTGTTVVTTCQYAEEFSVHNYTTLGSYTIVATGGTGNYLTVTNSAGTIVYASGTSPLTFNVPVVGAYRVHLTVAGPTSCTQDQTCHVMNVIAPGPPPSAPPNDLCGGAILLAPNTNTTGTTLLATTESPSPGTCGTSLSQPGVWYRMVGNGNLFGAGLCSTTSWDSKIFIYSGNCSSLTCVTGNDDFGPLCASAAASATWCSVPTVTYYILVTGFSSASNFTLSVTQTVIATPTLVVSATHTVTCPGVTNTLTVSGASNYTWSTVQTGPSITVAPTSNTTYTVVGISTAGCQLGSNTISINTSAQPPVVTVPSGSICEGGQFNLVASGATNYSYSSSNPVSPLVTTSYTITGTNPDGCSSAPVVATVTVAPTPSVSITANSAMICDGDTVALTASGANTYSWSTSATTASIIETPTVTTNYTVLGIDANGCENTAFVNVVVNPLPIVTVAASNTFLCSGQAATLTASGGVGYGWSGGVTTASIIVSPSVNTVYTVIVFSSDGCTAIDSVALAVNQQTFAVTASTTICMGSTITLVASGVDTYTWVNNGSTASIAVSPTVNTSYTVNATGNTCPFSQVVTVTVNPVPTVVATILQSTICLGESAVISATGGDTYTWSATGSGASLTVTPATSNTFTYSVVGTNTFNCSSTSNQVSLVVDACTGIREALGSSSSLRVYPNPTTGEFYVESGNTLYKTITVSDVTGRTVANLSSSDEIIQLQINEFANGIYYVKIEANETFEVVKIVKH